MSLTAGSRLGVYEIVATLGAGGMGEVYKARDRRLGRSVALKVLHSHIASDPKLRERFEREARAVSSLNHPHICTLYDVSQHEGAEFLVMEFVEGETLAERLARGPIPVEMALRYAIEIAEALDHAHSRGITHRDLKPANLMMTPGGIKLLDFGVAKLRDDAVEATRSLDRAVDAAEAWPSRALTATGRLTEGGMLLGTFEYMAPEQVQGQDADARADVFAFGAVLYEAITGRPAFAGATPAAVIGAVLMAEPPPLGDQMDVPPVLDLTLRRCLAKDPDERWQSIRDVIVPLRWALDGALPVSGPAGPHPRPRRWPVGVMAAVALIAVGFPAWDMMTRDRASISLSRSDVAPPPGHTFAGDLYPSIAVSPDGTRIVFRARSGAGTQLFVRQNDEFEARPIGGSEGAHTPFFSPDGRWIGFLVNGQIYKAPVTGGAAVHVTKAPSLAAASPGATWGPDGSIVFAAGASGLRRVSDAGGVAEVLTVPDAGRNEVTHIAPQFLPGGQHLLFTIRTAADEWRVAVLSLASRTWEWLPALGELAGARYVPSTGHLVYAQSGSLYAILLDLERRTFTGSAIPLSEAAYSHAFAGTTIVQFGASNAGVLAFMTGSPPDWTLVAVDRDRVRAIADTPHMYRYPRFFPDGRYLAVLVEDRRSDVNVVDPRGVLRSLTRTGTNTTPIWTPNSQRVTFSSRRAGSASYDLFAAPIDESAEAESLLKRDGAQFPSGWSPGGDLLAFDELTELAGRDIWMWSARDKRVEPVVTGESNERAASFSRDGQWLAYVSDETGRDEVYVKRYPGRGPAEPLSNAGGTEPVWSPVNPRQLFYRKGNQVLSVTFRTEPAFSSDEPVVLFEGSYVPGSAESGKPNYDVAPDGRSFVMVRSVERSPAHLHVTHSWFTELAR